MRLLSDLTNILTHLISAFCSMIALTWLFFDTESARKAFKQARAFWNREPLTDSVTNWIILSPISVYADKIEQDCIKTNHMHR